MTEPEETATPSRTRPLRPTAGTAEALRKPFEPEVVGTLPKPHKKDSPQGHCDECGGYHGLPAVHLSYVGHAAVTDRLLSVDPAWNWEPLALDENGLPATDNNGGMWIKLTVAGVTRLGYGDGGDPKVRIGDAIRNAAMRFGVALDLWTKDELESLIGNQIIATRKARPPRSATSTRGLRRTDPETDGEVGMTARDRNKLISALAHLDPPLLREPEQLAYIAGIIDKNLPALVKLSAADGDKVLRELGVEPS